MPTITLPDGKNLEFPNRTTGLQVAEKISKSLAKQAIVVAVDGQLKDLDFVIGVNLKGTFFCIQSYAAILEENNLKGSVINTASHYGIISPDFRIYTDCDRRNSEIYGATKAGIIQMTKYFAVELADKGIRINCVSPGGIFNPAQPQGDDFISNYSNRTPLGRMAEVHEIMGAYIYLASDTSTYTTGQNIIVDGGMSAW